MAVAVTAAVIIVVGVLAGAFTIRRRRRRPDAEAAERALRGRAEQAGAQERATRMHPDAVRDWMRRR